MKEVDIISKVVSRETSGKTATYIPGAGVPSVNLDDYLMKKTWDSVFEIRTDGEGNPYLYEKMPFVTQYGITMYAKGGDLDIPGIYDGLPIDGSTIFWQDGVLKAKSGTEGGITSITSDMITEALGYTPADAQDIPSLDGYATETYVTERISDLINGAPEAYDTLKEIADVLAGNVNSIGDIITTLGTKADKATTLAGYGITDAYTKTKVDELLDNYVTIATAQAITGEKNFTGGLKVNGSSIVYDATNKYWKLEGDLLVTGGVTMFASDSAFTPSTIMDGVVVDGVTIRKNPVSGALEFIGSVDGGTASSVDWENVEGKPSWIGASKPSYAWSEITGKPSFASVATSGKYSDLSGTPTLLSSFTDDMVAGKYLPLSGGDIIGQLTVMSPGSNAAPTIKYKKYDGTTFGFLGFLGTYDLKIWDANGQNDRTILHSGNWSQYVTAADGGNYLPLSGGTINGSLRVLSNAVTDEINTFKILNYEDSPYGLICGINANGNVSMQVRRESSKTEVFNMILQPNGGNVGVGVSAPNAKMHIGGDMMIGGWVSQHQLLFDSNIPTSVNNYTNARIGAFDRVGGLVVQFGTGGNVSTTKSFSFIDYAWQIEIVRIESNGNIFTQGGITMYSDIRKKTKLQDVELSLSQIANAPLIEHYYNSDDKRTTHVGSIAQYWAGINDWFCKLDNEGYYTMEIQNAALASAISIARHLQKYENKTDRKIRMLKERVKELENRLEKYGLNKGE